MKNRTLLTVGAIFLLMASSFTTSDRDTYEFLSHKKSAPASFWKTHSASFSLKDINGNKVSLDDLKGRFVYLHFWASWCKPCLAELPKIQELQEQEAGKNIAWVFVTFDKEPDEWKEAVKEFAIDGTHLMAGESSQQLKDDFHIKGIPKTVWIDANGDVIAADAPPAGSAGLKHKLDLYMKL